MRYARGDDLDSMADRYGSYSLLRTAECEGTDYRIQSRRGGSGVAVMAIHGGDIEPGTSEVAVALAADFHSLYLFEGVKHRGNRALHLASTRFDEPRGLHLALESEMVITVHGCAEKNPVVLVGGLAAPVVRRIRDALDWAGFSVDTRDGLQGLHPRNVCNLGKSGGGVQVELSSGLRRAMFQDLTRSGRERTTETFHRLVAVLAPLLPRMEATHHPVRPRRRNCHADPHVLSPAGYRIPDGA